MLLMSISLSLARLFLPCGLFQVQGLAIDQIPQETLKEEAASIERLSHYVAEWMSMCHKLGITKE
jgi:hypothetical protein